MFYSLKSELLAIFLSAFIHVQLMFEQIYSHLPGWQFHFHFSGKNKFNYKPRKIQGETSPPKGGKISVEDDERGQGVSQHIHMFS